MIAQRSMRSRRPRAPLCGSGKAGGDKPASLDAAAPHYYYRAVCLLASPTASPWVPPLPPLPHRGARGRFIVMISALHGSSLKNNHRTGGRRPSSAAGYRGPARLCHDDVTLVHSVLHDLAVGVAMLKYFFYSNGKLGDAVSHMGRRVGDPPRRKAA